MNVHLARDRPSSSSREHRIKLWSEYADALITGEKRFEVRKDDRGYAVGDRLIMEEIDRTSGEPTGWEYHAFVTYKMDGGQHGIAPDYCILGVEFVRKTPRHSYYAGKRCPHEPRPLSENAVRLCKVCGRAIIPAPVSAHNPLGWRLAKKEFGEVEL